MTPPGTNPRNWHRLSHVLVFPAPTGSAPVRAVCGWGLLRADGNMFRSARENRRQEGGGREEGGEPEGPLLAEAQSGAERDGLRRLGRRQPAHAQAGEEMEGQRR